VGSILSAFGVGIKSACYKCKKTKHELRREEKYRRSLSGYVTRSSRSRKVKHLSVQDEMVIEYGPTDCTDLKYTGADVTIDMTGTGMVIHFHDGTGLRGGY